MAEASTCAVVTAEVSWRGGWAEASPKQPAITETVDTRRGSVDEDRRGRRQEVVVPAVDSVLRRRAARHSRRRDTREAGGASPKLEKQGGVVSSFSGCGLRRGVRQESRAPIDNDSV